MQKTGRDVQATLLRAVDRTAEYVNGGMMPTDAVIKTAEELQLSPGRINLVVHAYNNGRTARQRMDGTTPFEKAADFPLADAGEVLERLYPTKVQRPGEKQAFSGVDRAYSSPPSSTVLFRQERIEKAAGFEKKAAEHKALPPIQRQATVGARLKKAEGEAQQLTKDIEEARRLESLSRDKMASAVGKLAASIRRSDAVPMAVFRENVEIMHGEKGAMVLDYVIKSEPWLMALPKHKAATPLFGGELSYKAASLDRARREPTTHPSYELVNGVLKAAEDYKAAQARYLETETRNRTAREAVLAPFAGSPADIKPVTEKTATGLWGTLGSVALAGNIASATADGLKPPDEDKLVNKTLDKLTDPEHESQLRAINTQATLQNFMLSDPVISKYQPQQVMDSFNQITQLAPSLADRTLALQAYLRQHLQQGAFSPFDVDQLAQLENRLRVNNMVPKMPSAGGGQS